MTTPISEQLSKRGPMEDCEAGQRDIHPIAPLGPRELARVERPEYHDCRCCICGWVDGFVARAIDEHGKANGYCDECKAWGDFQSLAPTDPEYESSPIDGTSNVLVTLPTGRTFQLPGNPTHAEIVAACYAFEAGLDQGKTVGLRKAFHLIEDAAEKAREELYGS